MRALLLRAMRASVAVARIGRRTRMCVLFVSGRCFFGRDCQRQHKTRKRNEHENSHDSSDYVHTLQANDDNGSAQFPIVLLKWWTNRIVCHLFRSVATLSHACSSIHWTICIQLVFHVHYFWPPFHIIAAALLCLQYQRFHDFCHRQQCVPEPFNVHRISLHSNWINSTLEWRKKPKQFPYAMWSCMYEYECIRIMNFLARYSNTELPVQNELLSYMAYRRRWGRFPTSNFWIRKSKWINRRRRRRRTQILIQRVCGFMAQMG